MSLAGQKVVVLSKFGAVTDLLGEDFSIFPSVKRTDGLRLVGFIDPTDRRSGIYSDRPRSIMTNEILTGGLLLAIMPYGDRSVSSYS